MKPESSIPSQSPWQRFHRGRLSRVLLVYLGIWVLLALLAGLLADDLPLACTYQGERIYPAFNPDQIDTLYDASGVPIPMHYRDFPWQELEISEVWWPLIPYGKRKRRDHRLLSPFGEQKVKGQALSTRFRHWLGTTPQGQDILAGLLYGARVSLLVGLVAMGIAAIIGIVLGLLAGFYGDYGLRSRRGHSLMMYLSLPLVWFYAWHVRRFAWTDAVAAGQGLLWQCVITAFLVVLIVGICWQLGKWLGRLPGLKAEAYVPLDSFLMRSMEVLNSLPRILLIITLAAFISRSLWGIMVLIGLLAWTQIARLTRAEMLRIKRLPFLESARALGLPTPRLLWRHALPHALAPIWPILAVGIGNAIMLEAALSFLELIQDDHLSWGALLSEAQKFPRAWWIALFPGLAIFVTVLSFNLLGERLRDALDPKTR